MAKGVLSKLFMPVLIICSVILIVVLQLGFIFLLMALLPSLTAYYMDFDPNRPAFKTVLASNLAATLPYLTPIFTASIKMKHFDISTLMGNPRVWLFIYAGAAAGWCLIFICRFVANMFITVQCDYQVSALEAFQEKLLAEWGQQINQSADAPPSVQPQQ